MRETEAQGLSVQSQGSSYKVTESLLSEPARHTAQCSEGTIGKGTSAGCSVQTMILLRRVVREDCYLEVTAA